MNRLLFSWAAMLSFVGAVAQTTKTHRINPWELVSYNYSYCSIADNETMAYADLDNTIPFDQGNKNNRIEVIDTKPGYAGFAGYNWVFESDNKDMQQVIYSLYEVKWLNLLPGRKYRMKWGIDMIASGKSRYQDAGLYIFDDYYEAINTKVKSSANYSDEDYSTYDNLLCYISYHKTDGSWLHVNKTFEFYFDNTNNGERMDMHKYLLLAHTIADGHGGNQWVIFQRDPEVESLFDINHKIILMPNGANENNIEVDEEVWNKYTTPLNTFTREGYTFAGWNTKADGTGTAFDENEELDLNREDLIINGYKNYFVRLYAQWTQDQPTGIEASNVTDDKAAIKVIDNGQIVIIRNGEKHDLSGRQIK